MVKIVSPLCTVYFIYLSTYVSPTIYCVQRIHYIILKYLLLYICILLKKIHLTDLNQNEDDARTGLQQEPETEVSSGSRRSLGLLPRYVDTLGSIQKKLHWCIIFTRAIAWLNLLFKFLFFGGGVSLFANRPKCSQTPFCQY
jgi:hypothetical protein